MRNNDFLYLSASFLHSRILACKNPHPEKVTCGLTFTLSVRHTTLYASGLVGMRIALESFLRRVIFPSGSQIVTSR